MRGKVKRCEQVGFVANGEKVARIADAALKMRKRRELNRRPEVGCDDVAVEELVFFRVKVGSDQQGVPAFVDVERRRFDGFGDVHAIFLIACW